MELLALEQYTITIKNHHFIPDKLIIPSSKKIKIIIDNQDDEVEEFESFDLHREKIVPGKSKIIIKIGPLEAREYRFFGDFHRKTANGLIIAE